MTSGFRARRPRIAKGFNSCRDVGLGRAGLVMGLEVSRLARNSTDWHRLLEICALTETLILDEDGLYDPAHFNDRLLLGLKGTMSEAELHVLRARLRGGIVNKARRGELEMPVPVGFVYDAAARVTLDPDQRVQETIRTFFQTFRRTGSATATVKDFRDRQLMFPRHARHGIHHTGTRWVPLEHSRALWVLHNPRFAGAFFFGRSRQRRTGEGRMVMRCSVKRSPWHWVPDRVSGRRESPRPASAPEPPYSTWHPGRRSARDTDRRLRP